MTENSLKKEVNYVFPTNDNYIDNLPDEVLRYIFVQLLPYRDLNSCRLVSSKWYKLVQEIKPRIYNEFKRALITSRIKWESYQFGSKIDITNRYSHSAVGHENFMYVFGGFTQNCTAFNDLWRLDLSNRKWERIIAEGTNPGPKGCATLLTYQDTLILFGGRQNPVTYNAFSNYAGLYIYNIKENKWTLISAKESHPPPVAGHSATIHGDSMVVFGGLEFQNCSNKVKVLDLVNMEWYYPSINGPEPHPRYNHSQVALDVSHMIIMGGCFSPSFKVLQDMWLLKMGKDSWIWHKIDIGTNNVLNTIWCHPTCKVGPYIVGFTNNMQITNPIKYASWFSWRDIRYGPHEDDDALKQLRFNCLRNSGNRYQKTIMKPIYPLLRMYVIDTSDMLSDVKFPLKWHYCTPCLHTPVDTISYSLVSGNAELILFGGMQKKTEDSMIAEEVNFLHFMKSKTKII